MAEDLKNIPTVEKIKLWLFPIVVGILYTTLNSSLQEMKTDIKTLLAQSERDQVKIEYLEQEVNLLRSKLVSLDKLPLDHKTPFDNEKVPPQYAIIPNSKDGTTTKYIADITGL